MTVQDPRATPSPPSTVPSPNDTTESNASDVSEVDELSPKKTPTAAARGSVSESESAKTRAVKHDIADNEDIIPYLIPESSELETEDVQVHHWHIKDWKALEDRCHGPVFHAGGFPWRILLFPRGNNQDTSISVYLEVADPTSSGHPPDWHVCAHFALVISNPEDSTNFHSSSANHRFSADEVDWGFTKFLDIKSLPRTNPSTGKGPFLVNNQVVLSVFVRVIKDETGVLWHNFQNYDSRKETGYVGIKNQGATCYMNSLLQSLYCTNSFRRAVYQIPTENDKLSDSVPLALQRCFYQLQYSDLPVGTTELTRSFGWDSLEAFNQHDVQEFNRVLQDRLEEKMKGTPADGAISKLFLGKMKSYIKCINVDYESSRVEDYYDIQLNVKGCKDLEESFKHYVTVETLEGENKYMAEGYGLQDAKKGVIFESFPPVLHLQLKRFEYDFMRDTMVKINDRHEFPEEINLDKFCSQSDPNDPYDYVLHGVLVHSGDLHGGHYFALIKPEKDGKWLRFDDDRVTPVKRREVFEENYGDEPLSANGSPPLLNGVRNNNARLMKRFTNAYMLVYIRKSKLDEVLGPVADEDIPPHLKRRINEERAALEKRRKDREDMHLHVKVAVVTDSSFADRQEFDLAAFDDKNLECSEGVTVFKVLKSDKIGSLRPALIERFGLQNEKFRLWTVVNRSNKTIRVEQPLTATDEKQSFEKLRACVYTQNTGFAKLYLESADHLPNGKLPNVRSDLSLIFIKYFDIKQQKMIGLGRMYVKGHEKVGDITPALIERAKLPKDTAISIYEEVKPASIDFMNIKQSFQQSEIQNGGIICFQIAVSEEQAKQMHAEGRFATVREYFASIYNRVMVEFRPKADKRLQEVTLTIDRRSTYLTVARELAKAVDAEPTKLRFTTAHTLTRQPKDVLPYSSRLTLEMMAPGMPNAAEYAHAVSIESVTPAVIYYEVLDVSLVDLETKKSFKVNVLHPTLRDETPVDVLVPKTGVGRDLIQAIVAKSKLDTKDLEKIRVFEVVDGQIVTELSLDQPVDALSVKVGATLYAEQIPDEELKMDQDNDIVIQVVHYHKDPLRLHGVPFRFVVKKDEPFTETKKRLQKRIGISDKEWQKVKFTVVRNISSVDPEATPIEGEFSLYSAKLGADDALGLDRVDKSRSSRFGGMFERGIFIRG